MGAISCPQEEETILMSKIKNKPLLKDILCILFIFVTALGVSLIKTTNPLDTRRIATDSSVFKYVAHVMLSGGMPYKDSFDHKGPLIYLIDALGLLIDRDWGIWCLELVSLFIIFYFTFRTARLLGASRIAACAAAAAGGLILHYCLNGGNRVEEYATVFTTVSLYIFLKYFISGKAGRFGIFTVGFSLAAVVLLKINLISLWAVMCSGVFLTEAKNKRLSVIPRFIFWFLLGFLTLAIPVIAWLVIRGAFSDFIFAYFTFNLIYIHSAFRRKMDALFYFLTGVPVTFCLPVLLFFNIIRKECGDRLCLAGLILSLMLASAPGHEYIYYGMAFYPFLVYAVIRLLIFFGRLPGTQAAACYAAGSCLFLLMFAGTCREAYQQIKELPERRARTVYDTRYEIADIIRQITEPGDKITVCGNSDQIYLASGRESASRFSYQQFAGYQPVIADQYIAEISADLPAVIVIRANFQPMADRMHEITEKHYRLIDTVIKNETDPYEIYLRNGH